VTPCVVLLIAVVAELTVGAITVIMDEIEALALWAIETGALAVYVEMPQRNGQNLVSLTSSAAPSLRPWLVRFRRHHCSNQIYQ